MKKRKKFLCADLFCGGGGTSTGMIEAFRAAGVDYELVGVNHWQIAIDTNQMNHAGNFRRDGVEKVSPRELVPGGKLDFLWASPECTNHSRAKGGRPKDEQSRTTAWNVLKWPQELYIRRIYIENVAEFLEWGPVDEHGRVIKEKKGKTFRAFVGVLKSLGYRVDYQIMNAADFGAPTSRKRLIIQAVRDKERIRWPEPTHAKTPALFREKPWVPAREIIDWSIPGKSIFDRRVPLAPNTLRRIYSGVVKYWGPAARLYAPLLLAEIVRSCRYKKIDPARYLGNLPEPAAGKPEPFLIAMRGTSAPQVDGSARPLSGPLPAVSAGGIHAGIVEPFISRFNGGDHRNYPPDRPIPPQDCSNRYGIVTPFAVPFFGENGGQNPRSHSVGEPLPTVTGHGAGGLVEALVVPHKFNNKPTSAADPLPTVTTVNGFSLVEALFVPQHGGGTVKPTGNPLPTVAAAGAISMVEPVVIATGHTSSKKRTTGIGEPISTVVTKAEHCLIEPFAVKFYGKDRDGQGLDRPLGTVTTRDTFALAGAQLVRDEAGNVYKLDILFRMFQPHELAAAMSFPAGYRFAGNKGDQVRQIGNAVPPKLAQALIGAALGA